MRALKRRPAMAGMGQRVMAEVLPNVTRESVSMEELGFRFGASVKELQAVAYSQERQAERSLRAAGAAARAAWVSVGCAVIVAVMAAAPLVLGETKATTYAHCQLTVLTTATPRPADILSVCMRAAGYRDTCQPTGMVGAIPECFAPNGPVLWLRDAIRGDVVYWAQ